MFCGKCGAENENGAKFCKVCGAELESSMGQITNNIGAKITDAKEAASVDLNKAVDKVKSVSKPKIIGITAVAVAVVAVIFMIASSGPSINLNDYLTIETEGYDGYGTARTSIDWAAIEEKYGKKLEYKSKSKEEYGGLLQYMSPVDVINEKVRVSLDQTGKLSNDSEISYKWEVDEDLSEYVNCKVKFKDSTFKVEGLTEVGVFDPFELLSVSFYGIAPNGEAAIEYSGTELSDYDFNCDKTYGLRNGDKVKITLDSQDMSYYAERLGKIPSVTEKEFEVSGLDEYVDQYSKLSDDFIATLKKEAEDSVYSYTANSYNSSVSLSDLSYAGYIFLSVKDGDSWGGANYIYIVYKGMVTDSENAFAASTVYYPVRFDEILNSADGLSYKEKNGIIGSSSLDGGWYSTQGYTNPLTCYIDIVEGNKESYNAECGDGFEAYAEYNLISKIDDIGGEYKKSLYADAKDKIESYIARDYNDGVVSDLAIKGEYLLLLKNQNTDFRNNNKYFVVYSATVSSQGGNFDTTTVYYPVEYDGVVKLPGDEFMVTTSNGIVGNSGFQDSWYSTKGYTDGAEMYAEIITSNRDNYTYEVSEGLKELGE